MKKLSAMSAAWTEEKSGLVFARIRNHDGKVLASGDGKTGFAVDASGSIFDSTAVAGVDMKVIGGKKAVKFFLMPVRLALLLLFIVALHLFGSVVPVAGGERQSGYVANRSEQCADTQSGNRGFPDAKKFVDCSDMIFFHFLLSAVCSFLLGFAAAFTADWLKFRRYSKIYREEKKKSRNE